MFAAMDLFGRNGFDKTSVRAIAEAAGVSSALIFHHYGSKDGLIAACNSYMLASVRDQKMGFFASGFVPDMRSLSRENQTILAYTGRVLTEGGESAAEFFNQLAATITEYLAAGEEAGLVRPAKDPQARAAVLTAMGAGAALFAGNIVQHLGGESFADGDVFARYLDFALDFYTNGIITPAALAAIKEHT